MHYIRVNHAHLGFPIHLDEDKSLRGLAVRTAKRMAGRKVNTGRRYKAALSNINFTAKPGDRIGLMGVNGSGKTSLLRLIAGVYDPVEGTVIRRGRVASLIGISMGLDMHASGIENIFIRAEQMGMSKKQARGLVEDVVSFSELENDIDRPIRQYSSGMTSRLAFAIATTIRADIYLMDEWIGAGDSRFFARAQQRIKEMLHDKAILVLATHSDQLIQKWCNRALVLHHGSQYANTDVERGIYIKNELMKGNFVASTSGPDKEPATPDPSKEPAKPA